MAIFFMIKGSIVALVTPMEASGEIDWNALTRLVDFHIENGTDAIVSMGTTGESATVNFDEHNEVVVRTISDAAGRIPVIAGTGANSTQEAIALTESARQAGATASLLVVPYYNKPTQEGLYQHFRAIAEAVAIPQILYNVPGRTACDMDNDTTVRLADIPNIIGIKDATGDMARGRDLIERLPSDFAVYSGDDATSFDLLALGGSGSISVTANVAPQALHEMMAAGLAGDLDLAREINHRLMPLHKALFLESNPIPVKWAVSELGLMEKGIRLPLTLLSSSYESSLRDAMSQAGVV